MVKSVKLGVFLHSSNQKINAMVHFILCFYTLKVPSTTDTMLSLGFHVVLKITLSILAW